MTDPTSIEDGLFVDALRRRYGLDLGLYAGSFVRRRLGALRQELDTDSLLGHLGEVLRDERKYRDTLAFLMVGSSQFFREPDFFAHLDQEILPVLATYASVKVWTAGCSGGQELVSLAVLLSEHGILPRATIFASDIDPASLDQAAKGIFKRGEVKQFTAGYITVSGRRVPSDYYVYDYDNAKFDKELLRNVIFLEHDLTQDPPFESFHLVLCRNVLIYFQEATQRRAEDVLAASVATKGYLGLGKSEPLPASHGHAAHLVRVHGEHNWYQRVDETRWQTYREAVS